MASSDLDRWPISPACVKALTDRIEDKRKLAASEIEKMTIDFSVSNNLTMINRLIIILGNDFCLSSIPNARKGGLLGLAAVMVGFKNGSAHEPPKEIVEEIVRPILTCFLDSDSRVRYYACESLYNVTKVAKARILPLFDSIFDNLSKIVADHDMGVRSGAEVLDRLLKDIVVEEQNVDIVTLVPRLEEYIYAKNPFTRMFIISWIRLLDSKLDMIDHLPQLLDGVFNCLYDSTEEIRASTLGLLSEFLNKIVARSTDRINIPSIVSIILKHSQNDKEDVVQYTAIAWLRQFILLMNPQELINFSPSILIAILPCLAFKTTPEGSITSHIPNPTVQRFIPQSPSRGNICEISSLVNSSLLDQVTIVLEERRNAMGTQSTSRDIEPIVETLMKELQRQEHPIIKLATLDWFKKLKRAEPDLVLSDKLHEKLLQILLETLSVRSDAVVKNVLRVIANLFNIDRISEQQVSTVNDLEENSSTIKDEEATDNEKRKLPAKSSSILQKSSSGISKRVVIAPDEVPPNYQSTANMIGFIQTLYQALHKKVVFEERGTFIVLNLCSMVKPEIIYRSFSEILKDEKTDLKFAYNLVQKLNQILLSSQPLIRLRSRLGNDNDPEMTSLFHDLYYAWCHSPIAALTLCLLTNNYKLASQIVTALSETSISLNLLTQIDWLVQLIESPVFAPLRMRLLDANNNQYLLLSMYGLLMILPQSEAYKRLGHRLDQVYKFMSAQPSLKAITSSQQTHKPVSTGSKDSRKTSSPLMDHFVFVQEQHLRISCTSEMNDD